MYHQHRFISFEFLPCYWCTVHMFLLITI
uniref:Uncharacterized protein n=1 Tax=Rhizophora mucronata TaxID=61149 RepID=A0A2P2NBM9_RHIMU